MFVSEAQRRLCYARYNQDIKQGIVPRWDCPKWDKATKKTLPLKVTKTKSKPVKAPKKTSSPKVYRKAYYKKPYVRKDIENPKKTIKVKGSVVEAKMCPKGQILRVGYNRKPYTRKTSSGKTVTVKGAKVSPRCVKDTGKAGKYRGTKLILPKISLSEYGYKMALPDKARQTAIRKAVSVYGKDAVKEKILKLAVLFSNKPQSNIVNRDLEFVKKLKK